MSDAFYASCAEVLALCQHMKDDLASLLDPEKGFAPQIRKICREQLAELESDAVHNVPTEDLDLLRLESNTWGLLQVLMAARKTEPPPLPTARALLAENPYTPTSALAQAVMHASPLLSELVVVREWLHDTAPPPHNPEATTGFRPFTKHRLMQALRMGPMPGDAAGTRKDTDGLVKHVDPDAVGREEGRGLAVEDANYEKSLAQALYAYVRAGRLEDALDLCVRAQQPWRAASIRGSLLFQWRAITTGPRDDDSMDDVEEDEGWRGNKRRRLWKTSCTRAALNPSLPPPDRVLYAALAPSPATSAVLKGACRTWADHLWAQVSIVCEEKESAELSRLGASRGGAFWEGAGALEALDKEAAPEADAEEEESEEEEWGSEVMGTLETLGNVVVEDGPPADHAFHVSQLHIILNRTDQLLDGFANGLRDGLYDPGSPDYPTMTRFFAHVCLFLQLIDVSVPPLSTQIILEAYLQVLENAGQRDLIAMYAGALGENAVERYALFLTSLALTADPQERREALIRAREHGLDVERVAVVAAERTIEAAFEVLPPLKGPLPILAVPEQQASDPELLLLRSYEWTVFSPTTYDTALEQTNVILRYFLGAGRVHLARTLLHGVPPELASLDAPEERANEYLNFRQFFAAWDALESVPAPGALDAPGASRDARAAWVRDYKDLIDQARELVEKVLTSEWLVSDVERSGGDRRRKDLIRIRQIYVPELIIRLHTVLYASHRRIPENLKHALELANTVADSRYKLYEDFTSQEGRRLGDYLAAVRQAVLGGLEGGGSDPFRVVNV